MRPVFIRSESLPRAEDLSTLLHRIRPEKEWSYGWSAIAVLTLTSTNTLPL